MGQITRKFRLAILLALMALAIPISMGCFESPLQSLANNESITSEDTTSTIDSQEVGDTTDPMEPSEPEPARVLGRNSDEISSNPLLDLLTSALRFVTKLLGGVISLVDMTLTIPAGALDQNTNISVDMPNPDLYIYDFGPDGLQFNIPATITISYDYADLANVAESRIRLGWWDENAQAWIDMPCVVDTSNNTVTGAVDHFSSYGLISD